MALPAALAQGAVTSTGCVGDRVYTELGEDELYVAIPGHAMARGADGAVTIASANSRLADYHQGRRKEISSL